MDQNQRPGGPSCRITEIKEKMDELRITCEAANEQTQALINEARLESARTCQVCGKHGTLHILPGNMAATLCEADAEWLSKPVREIMRLLKNCRLRQEGRYAASTCSIS